MTRVLLYAVPNKLKLIGIDSKLILIGEYGRVQLNSLKLSVFAKRSKLVLCSNCICYAAAKLANAIKGALCGHIR